MEAVEVSGIIDFLQGASNSAASTISGPIDLIALALRKAGVPVGDPVLGSDWMARRGLTAQPKNQIAGLLGEAAGMSAPIAAAAKAPQIARGLLRQADDFQRYNKALGPAGASQATVWHGSPHKFDRFDSSKIGTGEGAQAYGHGLYLAESPDVAMGYRASVAPKSGPQFGLEDGPVKGIATLIAARGQKGEEMARKAYANSVPDVEAAIAQAKAAIERASSLYKVDLPDSMIARMLDWDKPLSQQAPEVQSALKRYMGAEWEPSWSNLQGVNAYDVIAGGRHGNPTGNVAAAEKLRSAGIPGIRYLDGGSRGAGQGASNFVVFPGEEGLLTILERNGVPLR